MPGLLARVPAMVDVHDSLVVVPLGNLEIINVVVHLVNDARTLAVEPDDQIVLATVQWQVFESDFDRHFGIAGLARVRDERIGAKTVKTVAAIDRNAGVDGGPLRILHV